MERHGALGEDPNDGQAVTLLDDLKYFTTKLTRSFAIPIDMLISDTYWIRVITTVKP